MYLHFSIVVYYKTVRNNVLSVNYSFNSNHAIKWMPPYWDNKALPKPTLTLPDTLISTFLLFPSFLLKIIAFPMQYEIWKGRNFWGQKADSNSVDRVKKHASYHLRHWNWCLMSVFLLCWLFQSHFGGQS